MLSEGESTRLTINTVNRSALTAVVAIAYRLPSTDSSVW